MSQAKKIHVEALILMKTQTSVTINYYVGLLFISTLLP